ncbi:hypothetical protein [Herbidospora sp. RD11066]
MGVLFSDGLLWSAAHWSYNDVLDYIEPHGFDTTMKVMLVLTALVKAVFLWLILRTPERGPLDGRARALRVLLYVAVADVLVLWIPFRFLPDEAELIFQLVLWTSINVLFLLVIHWRSPLLRAAAGVMFAVGSVGLIDELLDELDLPELPPHEIVYLVLMVAGLLGNVLTLVGQRRDGRWSVGTLIAGWLSLGVYIPAFFYFTDFSFGGSGMSIGLDAIGLLGTLWIAATAREMAVGGGPVEDVHPGRQRLARVATASVIVLPIIASIPPEETPRLTYSGWDMDCYDRRPFGDLKPEELDDAFLCRARSVDSGIPPMFPDTSSDQEVLAYGRELCGAKDREAQEAILTRAGSERPAWGVDDWDLVYLCPDVVGAARPDLLRSEAEEEADHDAYIAEANAACRDPWPKTKGVVQATANYFLFADGDPGYMVYDPVGDTGEESFDGLMDRLFDGDTGIGLGDGAALVGHLDDVIELCLTVKAFRAAPPRRLAGWDQVTEVPLVSRSGTITIPEMDGDGVGAAAPMPNLAIAGKGRYRVRVYARIGGQEEHLVVVYPGTSRRTLKLKEWDID